MAVENPERPFVVMLGGAKVSDKILLIDKMADKADKILIGTALVFTFRKQMGHKVGTSLVEDDRLEVAKEIREKLGDKLYLSEDYMCHTDYADEPGKLMEEIEDGYMGLDIGPKTISQIEEILSTAKTVI
jgi:phosphoglycerate kinase